MNRIMNNYPEPFRGQNLPQWFRSLMTSQRNPLESYPMMTISNVNKSYTVNDQENYMRPGGFVRNDFSQETYHRSTTTRERDSDYFPFYRFGNWNSSFNTEEMARYIRIQTSRPIRDQYGDYYNLGASFMNGGKYHFLKYPRGADFEFMNPGSNYQVIGSIPSRFPNHLGYFHAYGMTDNYMIFCEQPCAFDINKLSQSGYYGDTLEYIQGEYNHFYIMDKRSGRCMDMSYVTDKPYFFYNFINCYEYENRIVIDVMGFDEYDFGSSMKSSRFFTERYSSSKIMRFVLPLSGRGMSLNYANSQWREASFDGHRYLLHPQYLFRESGLMNPFINPNYNFRKYQYAYGMRGNSLMKFDTEYGRTFSWRAENDYWRPYRSMFISNPSGRYEDDGVIISCFKDTRGQYSSNFMVFIDAHNMEELSRFHFDGQMNSFFDFNFPYYFM